VRPPAFLGLQISVPFPYIPDMLWRVRNPRGAKSVPVGFIQSALGGLRASTLEMRLRLARRTAKP
jgi:hypothetical protein